MTARIRPRSLYTEDLGVFPSPRYLEGELGIFLKFQGLHAEEELGIFSSPRANIMGRALNFSKSQGLYTQVPKPINGPGV